MSKLAIMFIITFLGGTIGAIFVDGVYGICLYEIEYFLNPNIRWWSASLPAIRYSMIIAVCTLVGYVIRHEKYSENRIFEVPQTKWLLAITLLMGLLSFIAVWPEHHYAFYTRHLKIVFFIFLVYKMVDSPQKFERMVWSFLIGCFYIGWVGWSTNRVGGRLEGIGPQDASDANLLSSVLICAVPILIFNLIEKKGYLVRIVSVIFLAFIVNAIVLCNSRGAFIGLVVSIGYMSYFVFFKRVKSLRFKIKMAVGLCGFVLLFFYLTDDIFWERMDTLKSIEMGDDGISGAEGGTSRTHFWAKGLELAKEHPLGLGAGGFSYLSSQFLDTGMLSGGRRVAHSTWIQLITNYGYLGFVLFLGFIFSSFKSHIKLRKQLLADENYSLYYQSVALNASFLSLLAASTFINRVQAELMYWLPAFMACFYNIYSKKIPLKNESTSKVRI